MSAGNGHIDNACLSCTTKARVAYLERDGASTLADVRELGEWIRDHLQQLSSEVTRLADEVHKMRGEMVK